MMGYLNPILSYGPERFCRDAAASGVDGLIAVDLPTEEADLLLPHANAQGLDIIRLVAPTTDDARMPFVLERQLGLRLLRQHHRDHRDPHGDRRRTRGQHPAHPAGHGPADRGRLRRPHPRPGGGGRRFADAAVVASALIDTLAASLDERAAPGPIRSGGCWSRCARWPRTCGARVAA